MKKESFFDSLKSTVFWKGLSKATGLIKHILIASFFGLSAQLDVFFMSMGILSLLVFSWASLLDVLAVPRLAKLCKDQDRSNFNKLSSGMFVLSLIFSFLICAIYILNTGTIAKIAFGFENKRNAMLIEALSWMLPIALIYIPMRQISASMRAQRYFSISYKGEFLLSISVLGILIFNYNKTSVLFWSFTIGVFVSFVYHLVMSRKYLTYIGKPFSTEIKKVFQLAPNLLILQFIVNSYVLTDRIFISFLPEGSVGALAYAWTIVCLVPALINTGGSFVTVFVEHRENEDNGSLIVNKLLSFAFFIGLPSMIFLLINSSEIIHVLLERGLFNKNDTILVATALIGYSASLVSLILVDPLDQIYQVSKKIGLIVRRSALGLVSNVVLNYIFIFELKMGVGGVAFATSISSSLMVISNIIALKKIGIVVEWIEHLKWISILVLISLTAGSISNVWDNVNGIGAQLLQIITYIVVVIFLTANVKVKQSVLVRAYIDKFYSQLFKEKGKVHASTNYK